MQDVQGILTSGGNDQPVSSGISSQFFLDSLSVSPSDILYLQSGGNVHYKLETGSINDDAMYINDVNEVACTLENVTKGLVVRGRNGRWGDRAIGP